jgi:hypothetical protein
MRWQAGIRARARAASESDARARKRARARERATRARRTTGRGAVRWLAVKACPRLLPKSSTSSSRPTRFSPVPRPSPKSRACSANLQSARTHMPTQTSAHTQSPASPTLFFRHAHTHTCAHARTHAPSRTHARDISLTRTCSNMKLCRSLPSALCASVGPMSVLSGYDIGSKCAVAPAAGARAPRRRAAGIFWSART